MLRKAPMPNVRANPGPTHFSPTLPQQIRHLPTQPTRPVKYSAAPAAPRFAAMPKRQFHQTMGMFAPCHGGPDAAEVARQEYQRYRQLEQDLCELRSLMCKMDGNKLDPTSREVLERHKQMHKQHRQEEFNLIIRSAEQSHQDIVRKISDYESTIKKGIREIEHASKQLPFLKQEADQALEKLRALKEVDIESNEFLDRESTSHFAPKYKTGSSGG